MGFFLTERQHWIVTRPQNKVNYCIHVWRNCNMLAKFILAFGCMLVLIQVVGLIMLLLENGSYKTFFIILGVIFVLIAGISYYINKKIDDTAS